MAAPPWYNPSCTVQLITLCLCKVPIWYILKFAEIGQNWPALIRIVFKPRQNIFPDWRTFISWQWQFSRHCQSNHLFSVFTSSSKSVRRPGVFHRDSAKLLHHQLSILLSSFLMSNKESINRLIVTVSFSEYLQWPVSWSFFFLWFAAFSLSSCWLGLPFLPAFWIILLLLN